MSIGLLRIIAKIPLAVCSVLNLSEQNFISVSVLCRNASSFCYTNWGNQSNGKALHCRCWLQDISWTFYTPWHSGEMRLFYSLQWRAKNTRTAKPNILLLIFLNTSIVLQPVYSPSILIDMMRPDGSSTLPVLSGDPLPADLAHELMGIQVNALF